MERPILKPIGTPSEELDTPSLVVDLNILESNISEFHSHFTDSDWKLRPHVQSHLSPAIAHMQLRAPGTVGGVAVSTLGQAETFAQHGFEDVMITNLAVTALKIARVAALAKRSRIKVGADNARNISDLSAAAASAGSEIGIMVVVRDDENFIGVPPADAAELSSLILNSPSLTFEGLISSDKGALLEAASSCSAKGIEAPAVALVLSKSQGIPDAATGATEIISGSYALMDSASRAAIPDLRPAARLLTTVMTHQDEGLVWLDAGQKATSIDTGLPDVDGIPGAAVSRMSAEHGGMVLEQGGSWDIDLGSKVWLVPHNIANTVNVYDYIHAVRDGKLEAVWEVAARGSYD